MTEKEAILVVDEVLRELVDDCGMESDEMGGEDWEEGKPVFEDYDVAILTALKWDKLVNKEKNATRKDD